VTARVALALALSLTAAVSTRPARADGVQDDDRATARAKQFFADGEKLFALGRFAAALEKYERAYEAKPLPGFLFNIGQCHRNLDEYDAAIFSFRKYLQLQPDAANREAVLAYISELEHEKQKRSSEDLALIAPDPSPIVAPRTKKPIYKKWWFWGGIAVLGVGAGTAIVLSSRSGPPDTDLGNIDFGR
jgi:tetratricopeptide (TPR) repeat protein